jgi:hypothetical protein
VQRARDQTLAAIEAERDREDAPDADPRYFIAVSARRPGAR